MKKKILIFSAGSSGKEILKLIEEINLYNKNTWKVIGFIDKNNKLNNKKIQNIKVYKNSKKFNNPSIYAICGIMDPKLRKKIYEKEILKYNFQIPNLIHPNTIIPRDLKIGKGNVIFNNVHLSFNLKIKDFTLISNFSDIGHNIILNNFVTIMPQTSIGGKCLIGTNTFIGSGCKIHQNLKIGNNCIIGIGSTIIKNLKNNLSIINFQRQVIKKINT